jgi:hypothetical protein
LVGEILKSCFGTSSVAWIFIVQHHSYDDTFLVVRFLNGLKDEIRAPIALHRPKDVDTASALTLLQEEEGEHLCTRMSSRTLTKPAAGFSLLEIKLRLTRRKRISGNLTKQPGMRSFKLYLLTGKLMGYVLLVVKNGLAELINVLTRYHCMSFRKWWNYFRVIVSLGQKMEGLAMSNLQSV